jgi:hypothetical protein
MSIQDSFVATMKGNCSIPHISYSDMKAKVNNLKISLPNHFYEKVDVTLALVRDKKGNILKRPVAFYIPGAFSNRDINQNRRYLDFFTKKGYHTLAFINPWGTDYVSSIPKHKIGHVTNEGKAMYQLVLKAYEHVKSMGVVKGKSRLTGVSYGGFVSGMITAFNAESSDPLNLKDTTIISPPINLGKSIVNLDKLITTNRSLLNVGIFGRAYRYLRFCYYETLASETKIVKNFAKGLVVNEGFFEPLLESFILYNKQFNLQGIPDVSWGNLSPKFRKWRSTFGFATYLNQYAPEIRSVMESEHGHLYYWLNRAKKSGYHQNRVMLASNDFLNDVKDIPSLKNTLVIPTGGHYGFRHLQWYYDFLNKAY